MTIFRCKKHFKSEFIQKMIIKYAAFSSFYHKQNFNYLLHMLALQHWENCQCLPSSDIRTPTIKHRTICFSCRCIWDSFQDSRMIKKILHCYSLSLWNKPSDLKNKVTPCQKIYLQHPVQEFKFADWTNMILTFHKLDKRFYTPFLNITASKLEQDSHQEMF